MSHALQIARNEYRKVLVPYHRNNPGGTIARAAAQNLARLLHRVPEPDPIIGLTPADTPSASLTEALQRAGLRVVIDGSLIRLCRHVEVRPVLVVTEVELLREFGAAP